MRFLDADAAVSKQPRYVTRLVHPTYRLLGDACPKCGFPEAEGGYCPECGWSLPYYNRKERKNGLQQ